MNPKPEELGVEVSVLVVHYRTLALILVCLESLFRETQESRIEVLVWDNASDDGSAEVISEAFPDVHLVASDKNLGFGAANNRLASMARGSKLLLLNPDTEVLDNAVDHLLAFANDRPDARVWGGRTLFADGQLNPTSCFAFPTLWSCLSQACGLNRLFWRSMTFNPEGLGGWKRDSEREVDMVSGCFLMIDTQLWQDLQGFNPLFWMYAEDADLCFRARLAGAMPRVTPSATIIHIGGASERLRANKMVRLFKAKSLFFHVHWHPRSAALGRGLFKLYALIRLVGFFPLGVLLPDRFGQRRLEWRKIWARRGEWSSPPPVRADEV
jgi:N-acetylglucosaminyl-diphospho-decaprenol L-rhamnosyltransferase